jgi:hypothetical protein
MISALVAAVMPTVVAAVPTVTHVVTTRDPGHGAPPRVLWRPEVDAFVPARKGSIPRSITGIRMTFAVEIWGETVAQVETLREALLRGLHAVAAGSWSATSGQWAPVGMVDAGELYRLSCWVEGQQHDTPVAVATLTDAAITPPTAPVPGELDSGDTTP